MAVPLHDESQTVQTQKWKVFTENLSFLCHCEERSDAAIFKPKACHPVAKNGGTKQKRNPYHKKT